MPIQSPYLVSPFIFWPPLAAGRLHTTSIAVGAVNVLTVTASVLYASPICVPIPTALSGIGIEVTTFATGNVRVGIYRDSAGAPGALVVDSGAISTGTSNGFKSAVISNTLAPGWYWLAGVFSATPGVRAIVNTSAAHLLGFSSGTDTTIHAGISVAFTYAALPDPFTGGSALLAGNAPRFMVQA